MKIRLKRRGVFGVKKISLDGRVEKVEEVGKDNFPVLKVPGGIGEKKVVGGKGVVGAGVGIKGVVGAGRKGVSVYVKGLEGLGVIMFSPREVEMIAGGGKKIREKKKVVKKGKKKKEGK